MLRSALTAILVGAATAVAQLSIYEPTTQHFWVGNSSNTLAWSGSSPSQFTIFIANDNVNLLTAKLALSAVTPAYEGSLTIIPTVPAGTGYTIQLTDILNSSNIYTTSETFEIKQQGSLYPTDTISLGQQPTSTATLGGAGASSVVTTGTGASAAPSASASSTQSGAAVGGNKMAFGLGVAGAVVAVAMGVMA